MLQEQKDHFGYGAQVNNIKNIIDSVNPSNS
jgi:hypothetical protein